MTLFNIYAPLSQMLSSAAAELRETIASRYACN